MSAHSAPSGDELFVAADAVNDEEGPCMDELDEAPAAGCADKFRGEEEEDRLVCGEGEGGCADAGVEPESLDPPFAKRYFSSVTAWRYKWFALMSVVARIDGKLSASLVMIVLFVSSSATFFIRHVLACLLMMDLSHVSSCFSLYPLKPSSVFKL